MTVAELIAALADMPPDALVVCPGFDEAGIDETLPPRLVTIRRGAGGGHCGPHVLAEGGEVAVFLDWTQGDLEHDDDHA